MTENIHDIIARRKAARRGDYSDEGVADKLDGILSNVDTVGQDSGEINQTPPVMTDEVEVDTNSSETQTHADAISGSVGVLALDSSSVVQPTVPGRSLFGGGAFTESAQTADDPIQSNKESQQAFSTRSTTASRKERIFNTSGQLLNRRTGESESPDTTRDVRPPIEEKAPESRFGKPIDASALLGNFNEVKSR